MGADLNRLCSAPRRGGGRSARQALAAVRADHGAAAGARLTSAGRARRVRAALDGAGHQRVKIVASGGFDAEKIRHFETEGAPVDAYGVG